MSNWMTDILQPDFRLVSRLRGRSKAHEVIEAMGAVTEEELNDPEFTASFLRDDTLTAEDVGLMLIRQIAGFKWRLGECLHLCGRHSSATALWAMVIESQSDGTKASVMAQIESIYDNPGEHQSPDTTTVLGKAHKLMIEIDNQLACSLNTLSQSFIQAREFMVLQRARLLEEKNFSHEDWLSLDWPTMFHTVGTPFDSLTMSLIELTDGDDSLARNKYEQLHEAFMVSMNRDKDGKPEPLGAPQRSTIEQALADILGFCEPRGLDEVRAEGSGGLGMSQ